MKNASITVVTRTMQRHWVVFNFRLITFDIRHGFPNSKGNFHLAWKFRFLSQFFFPLPLFFDFTVILICTLNNHCMQCYSLAAYNILASFLFHYRVFFLLLFYFFTAIFLELARFSRHFLLGQCYVCIMIFCLFAFDFQHFNALAKCWRWTIEMESVALLCLILLWPNQNRMK